MILTAAEIANESKPMGEAGRLASLVFDPMALFHDLEKNRRWWVPYVLTILCSVCLTFSAAYKLGFRHMAMTVIHSDKDAATRFDEVMNADQKESILSTTETTFKVSAYATPVLVLLYNVLYGMALLWGYRILGIKQISFSAIFSVLLYADLIQDLRLLAASGMLYLSHDMDSFNIQDPIGSNVGFYLSSGWPTWLKSLLGAADLFTIWYLILIAIGCAAVGKFPRRTSMTIVFGLWLMVVSARVMWAAIS